jgi:DNA modification methylase
MAVKKDFLISNKFTKFSDVVIYHGNAIDFVKTIPDNSIKLIVTSPPYNTGKEYEEINHRRIYL